MIQRAIRGSEEFLKGWLGRAYLAAHADVQQLAVRKAIALRLTFGLVALEVIALAAALLASF